MEAAAAVLWTTRLLALGSIVSSVQQMSPAIERFYSPPVAALLSRHRSRLPACFRFATDPRVPRLALPSQIIASAGLLLGAGRSATGLMLAVVLAGSILREWSRPHVDGSERVLRTVAFSLLIGVISERHEASLAFLAVVAPASYASAGMAKMVRREWWTGAHLVSSLDDAAWNPTPRMLVPLRTRPWLAALAGTGLILWELTFPLALLRWELAVAYAATGVAFHVGLAVFLAHNTFFFPFVATYPALLWASRVVAA